MDGISSLKKDVHRPNLGVLLITSCFPVCLYFTLNYYVPSPCHLWPIPHAGSGSSFSAGKCNLSKLPPAGTNPTTSRLHGSGTLLNLLYLSVLTCKMRMYTVDEVLGNNTWKLFSTWDSTDINWYNPWLRKTPNMEKSEDRHTWFSKHGNSHLLG